jgi:hypothetical protein
MIGITENREQYNRALQMARQTVLVQCISNENRIWCCLQNPVYNADAIEILLRGKFASYHGLELCKKIWLCPVCASRVTRLRRKQLKRALDTLSATHECIMLTYTVSHRLTDSLDRVSQWVRVAHAAVHSGKGWQKIEKSCGWYGSARAIEIMLGVNGWHWHIHELAWISRYANQQQLRNDLSDRWRSALEKLGASASDARGLHLATTFSDPQAYIEKFGLVPELLDAASKAGRLGGIQPFQLADVIMGEPRRRSWAIAKLAEYACATKGVLQFRSGRKLRTFFRPAKEAFIDPSDAPDQVYRLTVDEWRLLSHKGKRARILDSVEDGTYFDLIGEFL